jgi:adenylate cyclase
LLSLPLLFQHSYQQVIKLRTFDYFVPKFKESGYFTVINLDEKFVDEQGGYPIPRLELAKIHAEIINAGALGVGWVLAMPHEDRLGGDEAFAEVLGLSNSVLSIFEYENNIYPQTVGTVILGEDVKTNLIKGTINNVEPLRSSTNEGLASAPVDVDNLVRQIPLLYQTPDGWVASYAIEVLKILVGADTYIIKTNELGIEQVRVQGLPPINTDSQGKKFVSWIETSETNLQELNVKDKFVFIGFTASGIMPTISSPAGLLEPHKIQTALAETILLENSPYIPNWHLTLELAIFIFSGLLIWLLTSSFGITLSLTLTVLVFLSTACYGFWTIQNGVLIDVTWSLIGQFIIASTSYYFAFRKQWKLREQIKNQFGKYLDERMVKKLQDNPDLCQVNGKRVDCSIIFTDLRGFTKLSESIEPEKVSYIMNNVLDVQVKAVNKYFGVTDKFIGDAGMFHFNTIIPQPDHHDLALKAVKEIQKNIAELNKKFQEENIPKIAIGLGVNSGVVLAGNFGASDRFAFSLIGDPCNVAARLESNTKVVGKDVLIGEETAKNCSFDLVKLDDIVVKGKKDKLKVYTFKK